MASKHPAEPTEEHGSQRAGGAEPPPLHSALTFGGGPDASWYAEEQGCERRPAGRRRAALATVAFGALAAAVAAIALAGGGGGSQTAGSLARAAYVTGAAPGFRFDMTLAASVGGQEQAIDSEGFFGDGEREGSSSVRVGGTTLTEAIKSPYVYVQLPSGAAAVADGKPWIRVDVNAYVQAVGGGDPLGQSTASPTQLLSMLDASGQVSTVGAEFIRGVATTHYHALVDFERLATVVPASQRADVERYAQQLQRLTGSSSLPIDVWIDSEQRVRRFSTRLELCTPQGKLVETVGMDLYDFGPQPRVSVPGPSEVSDLSAAVSSQTSQQLAQLGC